MIVYQLQSPSGKSYIGQTRQPLALRFKQHIQAWQRWIKLGRPRKYNCTKLYYAFDAHAPDSWEQYVIIETDDQVILDETEITHIKLLGDYNLLPGGKLGRKGLPHDDDHKRRMSDARKAYYETEDGQAWKKELSERMKGSNAGGDALKGKAAWNRNMKHTDDTKAKMSQKSLEWWDSPEGMEERKRKADVAMDLGHKNRGRKYSAERLEKRHNQTPTNVKTWNVTHPDGTVEIVKNISAFFAERGFNPKTASARISASGKYQGYKAEKVKTPE